MTNAAFLSGIDALIADLDGVLWRGSAWLPGAEDLVAFLRRHRVDFVLATNNASKPPEAYVERFADRGVAIDRSQVLTSALATAAYLAREARPGTPVFAVGGPGLHQALRDEGFDVLPDAGRQAEFVVAGIDFDLTYEKLAFAALQIQRGARFVATNADPTYPAEEGALPGAGTIVRAIEVATGVAPLVVGKPEAGMFAIALGRLGSDPARTVMLGDRLQTDILGGSRAGLRTVLVLTGVDDERAVERTGIRPDLVVRDLPHLVSLWRRALGCRTD